MSEEQNAPVTEEQEKEVEGQNQEQEGESPKQEGESPKQEGESPEQEGESPKPEGEGAKASQEDEKENRRRHYRVKVTGIFHMHPYFWGSLKAVATISIPGFTIRGIRIVQEDDEEEFRIYPPQGWVGRQEKSIVKVHNKEFWAQICEDVSNAYIVSREKWVKRKKKGKKKEEAEAPPQETQAEAVESKE